MTGLTRKAPPARPDTPRVSIGMPVWNGEAFIRQGIESLLGQSMGDFELIISDNASTDGTPEICKEYSAQDSRIRYSRTDRNAGLQANFARVLDLALAPYFMWGCPDDLWDRTYVAKMVDVLDHDESVVLAGSNAASIDQYGVVRRKFDNASVHRPGTITARARRLISAPVGGGHATLIYGLMRTPVIQGVGFRPVDRILDNNRGYFAVDVLTLFRLIFRGGFHVTTETLYFHRDTVMDGHSVSHLEALRHPRFERIPRLIRATRNAHQYFGDLRTIIAESSLDARQRSVLRHATVRQELRFYPSFAWALLARRAQRG